MPVVAARGDQLVQNVRKVLLQAGLELDRADAPGATDVEDMNQAGPDPRAGDDALDLPGDVMHVPMTAGVNCDFVLVPHGLRDIVTG